LIIEGSSAMQWSDISFAPPARTLRQFAGLSLLIFGSAACFQAFVRHQPIVAAAFGVLAVVIGLPGLIKPSLVRPVYVGSMILAFPIGWTVNKVVLACMFYGMFTPVGLFFRLTGRDSLSLRPKPGAETFWLPKEQTTDLARYFRSF
jgi:Saxitoxin biosynthesis operon protein SxtJ